MSIACLVEPERYRTAMPASQPDKSGSASASSTSGKFSGQWRRSGVPIGAENPAGALDIGPEGC